MTGVVAVYYVGSIVSTGPVNHLLGHLIFKIKTLRSLPRIPYERGYPSAASAKDALVRVGGGEGCPRAPAVYMLGFFVLCEPDMMFKGTVSPV
jgi:hypothetical protein